jgi:hypothetical protein
MHPLSRRRKEVRGVVAGRPRMGTFLVKRGPVSEEQLEAAMQHQVANDCKAYQGVIAPEEILDLGFGRAAAMENRTSPARVPVGVG